MPIAPYPKSVTRDQTNAACWSLGVDPATVREMHFTPREVTIRAAVLSEPYVGSGSASAALILDGLYAAETTVVIPVDPTEQDAPQDAKPQDRPQFPDFVVPRHPEPGSPLDAYIKACLSAGRKDIEDLRLCEPDPRYAPGGWTGPEDEKPEGMAQA